MLDSHIAFATAGLVVTGQHRDPLQQCRFAGAVLADDDGDGAIEREFKAVA